MRFQTPLVPAVLIKRYKRFLADVRLADGSEVTVHCPNPGAMTGLNMPGLRVWLEKANPKAKLPYGWRLVETADGTWAGIDTGLANKVVKEALLQRKFTELAKYQTLKPEQKYGERSRVDFLLSQAGQPDAYVEVKSVTLHRTPGLLEFPDSVTARGAKHLYELAGVAKEGHRAVLLFLVQHTAATQVAVANDIDPTYAAAMKQAQTTGVEVLCYGCTITQQEITLSHALPFAGGGAN